MSLGTHYLTLNCYGQRVMVLCNIEKNVLASVWTAHVIPRLMSNDSLTYSSLDVQDHWPDMFHARKYWGGAYDVEPPKVSVSISMWLCTILTFGGSQQANKQKKCAKPQYDKKKKEGPHTYRPFWPQLFKVLRVHLANLWGHEMKV